MIKAGRPQQAFVQQGWRKPVSPPRTSG